MRKEVGIGSMILLVAMAIFVSPCRGEGPTAAITLSDDSSVPLTFEQIFELLKQPGIGYSELAIPVPEEFGGGYIIGTEEDLTAAIEAIEAEADPFVSGPVANITPPSPKHFGNKKIGKQKSQTFTIKNGGTGDLIIGQITIIDVNADDQYSLTAGKDACSNKTLSPKKKCKFQVVFKPTLPFPQPLRSDVSVPSNDPNTPAIIQLFGAGI
jgi:hypothetical protein